MRNGVLICIFLTSVLAVSLGLKAEAVKSRHKEGPTRGFLLVRDVSGRIIANGDFVQTESRGRVESHVTFHFKDGSLYEEVAEFTQDGDFKLLRDHLIQSGPSFKPEMETDLDASTGQFTAKYQEKDEKKEFGEHLDLPADLSNGLIWTLLKNIEPMAEYTELSLLAASPKPRIVKLQIHREGTTTFAAGAKQLKAMQFLIHTKITGVAGVAAPLLGKQPPDTRVWVLDGAVPLFLKFEGPLYGEGPVWRIEPISPVGPKSGKSTRTDE